MSGRVLHVEGPYEGEEIDTIVEMDPEYILEVASTVEGHGISQAAINRAQQILDEPEDEWDEDLLDINNRFGLMNPDGWDE